MYWKSFKSSGKYMNINFTNKESHMFYEYGKKLHSCHVPRNKCKENSEPCEIILAQLDALY